MLEYIDLPTVTLTILLIALTMAHMINVRPDLHPQSSPFIDRRSRFASRGGPAPPSSAASHTGKDEHGGYVPTPIEVVDLRTTLVRAKKLPVDIVDDIFNHAEYWACNSNEIDFIKEHNAPIRINGSSRIEDKFLLRSYPVGLTGLFENKSLTEELAYDTNLPQPCPLEAEHSPTFFTELANYPTPTLTSPVRKIVFKIRSADQGSGGQRGSKGRYDGSWTWFQAGLERFDASQTCDSQCVPDLRYESRQSQAPKLPLCSLRPIEPKIEQRETNGQEQAEDVSSYRYTHPLNPEDLYTIQKNKVATRQFEDYTIVWRWDDDVTDPESVAGQALSEAGRGSLTASGEFVRGLRIGDVVTVWGKARFPAWVNNVERVSIDIYWAV